MFLPLLLRMLLPVMLLPLLLRMLLLVMLLPLLLRMLLLAMLLPLLLRMLLLAMLLPLLLRMLLLWPASLVLALFMSGMVLFLVVLVVLCINRTSESEQQSQNSCTGDTNCSHRCYLRYAGCVCLLCFRAPYGVTA
jgi:hypothetical protein